MALAAVVLQAFAAQLGARLVQLLQAGVQHGLGHQLQVAAAVKVHPRQGLVELVYALGDLGHLRLYAGQQRAHALVGGLVQIVLEARALGGQVFLPQPLQALQVMRQGFDLLRVIGECAAVFLCAAAICRMMSLCSRASLWPSLSRRSLALARAWRSCVASSSQAVPGGHRAARGRAACPDRAGRGGGQALAAQALLRLGAGLAFLPGGLGGLQPQQRLGLGLAVLLRRPARRPAPGRCRTADRAARPAGFATAAARPGRRPGRCRSSAGPTGCASFGSLGL